MPGAIGRALSATRFERKARLIARQQAHVSRRARRFRPGRIWSAAILVWACVASVAEAAEFDFGVGLSAAYESNIARVETSPQSEITESLLGGLFFRENTGDVSGRIQALAARRHFVNHTFSDDTIGFLDGTGTWVIRPQRFNWLVEDTFRMVQTSILAPETPANVSPSNAFSTGPDLIFPFSSVNSILLGGRYGRFDIKYSNADNQRVTGYLRGLHALSPLTKISLNFEVARVNFVPESQTYSSIFREDYYVRFENNSALNATSIILGTSRATTYGGGLPVEPSRLAALTLSQTLTTQSKVRFAFADQLSDIYSDLIAGISGSAAPRETGVVAVVPSPLATGDIYHSTRGELGYAYDGTRFGYSLKAGDRRVDFVNDDINNYQEGYGSFVLLWSPSSAMRFDANTYLSNRNYVNLSRRDVDRTYGADVIFRPGRTMTAMLAFARFVRQSTLDLNSYVDNRVTLTLAYGTNPADLDALRR